jgi:hypothetical protein
MIIAGLGQGVAFTTMYVAASTGVPQGNEGVASATAMTAQQLGGSLGLALLVALVTQRVTALGGTMAASSIQPAGIATSALHLTFAAQGTIAILGAATAMFAIGKGGVEGLALPTAMSEIGIEQTRRWCDDSCNLQCRSEDSPESLRVVAALSLRCPLVDTRFVVAARVLLERQGVNGVASTRPKLTNPLKVVNQAV